MNFKIKRKAMNFKRMAAVILSLCVLVSIVLIAGCKGPSPEPKKTEPKKTKRLETFKIAYLANGMYRDLFIAKEEGFFEANGIDAELVEIGPCASRMAALTSGQVEVTAASTSSAISATAAGAKVKQVVAAARPVEGHGDGYLVVRQDSPYNSIEDLEGKIIAVTGKGSSLWIAPIEEFEKAGVEADIRCMTKERITGLLAGKVDASVVGTREIAKFKGQIRPILTIEAWRTQNAGCGYLVKTEFLESKPELIRSFVEALKEARQFIKEHPKQAVKDELKYTKVPEEEWAEEQAMIFDDELVIHMWAARHIQQTMLEHGLLDQPVDLSDVVDSRFAKILEERPE